MSNMFSSLNNNQTLTESDIGKNDIKSHLQNQIQKQEMKTSGWRFDKIFSMTKCFHKTNELNGSNYRQFPLRSSAILNFENGEIYCFLWSNLASQHPCQISHTNRDSNYRHYFIALNNEFFDCPNGFR